MTSRFAHGRAHDVAYDNVLIDEAGSAEEALEKAAATRYDCIVLDLGLPGMSGLELLEHLSNAPGGVPPVVVYSGRDLSREENLLLRQYTDSIVVKGARSPERLLDEVSLFLHSIRHAPKRAANAGHGSSNAELAGRACCWSMTTCAICLHCPKCCAAGAWW
jgi:DNA-binding response OmpR family regulator